MSRAHFFGVLEFRIFDVDGDQRVGFQDAGHDECGGSDATDAVDCDGVSGSHSCRVQHRAGARQDRATDDRGEIFGIVFVDWNYVTAPYQSVFTPRIGCAVEWLFSIGCSARFGREPPAYGVFRNPCDDCEVAFFDVRNIRTDGDDSASAFVTEQGRGRRLRVVHLVQLRVAHAAGVELDVNLIGTGVRDLDLVDLQRLSVFDVDCGLASHVDELLARYQGLYGLDP